MELERGKKATLKEAATELGSRGNEGAVCSVANQIELKTGKKATLKEAATELSSRGNKGAVCSVANQMELKTGKKATLKEAATELSSRGNKGAVCSVANQMELKTGKKATLEAAATERASILGRKSVGKPKGNAVWAKVVQISGSDEEIHRVMKSVRIQNQKSVLSCAIRALACRIQIAMSDILGSDSSMPENPQIVRPSSFMQTLAKKKES
jgi:hypothetical protein